jgi:DNA-binding beta-propeller fold protein YncE
MALRHRGYVDLPSHRGAGGFDHAAVNARTGRVYVAHTANDAVDVIDGPGQRYIASIPDLPGVAGALVDEARDLVFTSNRAENAVGIFATTGEPTVTRVPVGTRPNGLAHDPVRHRLLAAHVGDPSVKGSFTVAIVDVATKVRVAELPVAGRTRWTVFDAAGDCFHVNIADPPQIVVIDARDPVSAARIVPMPSAGPHGMDLDVARRRLYCACDGKQLFEVDADSGEITNAAPLAGIPDVVFFNAALRRLYVAIGDPGVIEVFDTSKLERREVISTEMGAHTLAFDAASNLVYAFLPATHRAAVYVDSD